MSNWSVLAKLVWFQRDQRLANHSYELQQQLLRFEAETWPESSSARSVHFDNEQALYEALVSLWQTSSIQLHRLLAANGVRYFHFLQPNQYLPDSKPFGARERAIAFSDAGTRPHSIRVGYPALRAAGEELTEQGVSFYDLTQIFSSVSEPVYIDSCCHLNSRGNEVMAEAIAHAILDSTAAAASPQTGQ